MYPPCSNVRLFMNAINYSRWLVQRANAPFVFFASFVTFAVKTETIKHEEHEGREGHEDAIRVTIRNRIYENDH